ncbi:hypothetical protein EHQ58_09380 [Leptospira ognonensis]|uniref:DUF4340 domain-containing protein n=1 Tax=Leptospira ognonensis TaxID=2484945 RepID=A0A4R9K488_9LEPT|nr:hypothetical protein [Leptospira ognonensis]TGL59118.1 hypothetical protein EHQ58_09380 [Leptospira ognonensis]
MNKRFLYLIFTLIFLLVVFFFQEEKLENQSELNFWKENWKSIHFQPPKKEWCGVGEPAFISTEIEMRLYDRGWKKAPIFSISSIDEMTKEIVTYEGNYNIKNTFSDLSVLKTKFIDTAKEEEFSKYCLLDDAPKFILSLDSPLVSETKSNKTLYFGKKVESDSARILARESMQLISPYAYLLEKFRGSLVGLRERQFFTYNGGYIKRIELTGQGLRIIAENFAKKNQYESYVNQWSRPTGERIVLPPDIGNDWEIKLKALRADLYPDDVEGPGFSEVKKWKGATPEFTVSVAHSDSQEWKLSIYPRVEWKGKTYRPVLREISPYLSESMSFVNEESFQNFLQSALRVKSASRYERPNQKIQ